LVVIVEGKGTVLGEFVFCELQGRITQPEVEIKKNGSNFQSAENGSMCLILPHNLPV